MGLAVFGPLKRVLDNLEIVFLHFNSLPNVAQLHVIHVVTQKLP